MPAPTHAERRRLPLEAIAFVLVIFGVVVAGIAWSVRTRLRDQVLQREGEAVYSVALMQLDSPQTQLTDYGATDPIDDLFYAVLETSRLRGVIAVRLFDAKGIQRRTLPEGMAQESLGADVLSQMSLHEAMESFDPSASPEGVLGLAPQALDGTPGPLLVVTVPLHRSEKKTELLGVARYWVDGVALAGEFRLLDRQLWIQAAVAFGCGALLLVTVLAWAFGQLRKSHEALVARGDDLSNANRELSLVAKTSALGAISAHLIHDLKNPIAGLEGFVRDEAAGNGGTQDGEAWQEAVQTARRLRSMVTEVASLLRDEAEGAFQTLSASEIGQGAIQRSAATSAKAGVPIVSEIADGGELPPGRAGNLAILVLSNLLDNACKASPRGKAVRLSVVSGNRQLRFLVTDCGAGLPQTVQKELFLPKSSRPGGGGLGLAISQQLARHAGGSIELVRTGPEGTQFSFFLPW